MNIATDEQQYLDDETTRRMRYPGQSNKPRPVLNDQRAGKRKVIQRLVDLLGGVRLTILTHLTIGKMPTPPHKATECWCSAYTVMHSQQVTGIIAKHYAQL